MKYTLLTFCAALVGTFSLNASAQGQALPSEIVSTPAVRTNAMAKKAQAVRVVEDFEAVDAEDFATVAPLAKGNAKSASVNKSLKALAANQAIMGTYRTDNVCGSDEGLGFDAGTWKIANLISTADAVKFNGGKIVAIRYALSAEGASNIKPFLYEVNGEGSIADEPAFSLSGTNNIGWNTIELPTPYEINIDRTTTDGVAGFMIGIECTVTAGTYPIGKYISMPYNDLYVYGSFDGEAAAWNDLGDTYGNLAVQCIVEKDGGFTTADLKVFDMTAPRYVKLGGKASVSFYCEPYSGTINNAKFAVRLGDTDIAELSYPHSIDQTCIISQEIDIPATVGELAAGDTPYLTAYVKEINGAEPTDANLRLDDAVASVVVLYTESLKRQKQLYEYYTSTQSSYGEYGDKILTALQNLRKDIAPVAFHCNLSSGDDELYLAATQNIMAFSVYGIPAAAMNRYYYTDDVNSYGTIAINAAYTDEYTTLVANNFSTLIDASNADYPAFATVNIETSVADDNNTITVKVSGDAVSNIDAVMGDAVLTVYLTEDRIRLAQMNTDGSSTDGAYRHDNVIRAILSEPLGDALTFNGGKYEKTYTYTYTLGSGNRNALTLGNSDRLHIVAAISRPITYAYSETQKQNVFTTSVRDAWVTNANMCAVGSSSSDTDTDAITEISMDSEDIEAVYSLDGRLLTSPSRGLKFVRFKTGKTVKALVK